HRRLPLADARAAGALQEAGAAAADGQAAGGGAVPGPRRGQAPQDLDEDHRVGGPIAMTPAGVQMQVVSEPKFKCSLTHGPSGTVIHSEAPKDNGGTGGSFSPTDLVGAALASCAMTTLSLAASRENVPWGEARATVEKRMTPPPRRIGELVLEIT